jgi:drug/metabolite transporter (DMT)-like permease
MLGGRHGNAAIQFSSGGLILLIASPLLDNYSMLSQASAASIWSLVYLVFFGSIIPYLCYLYAIKHLQVGLVSVYAYINPFIAILLGMLVLGENAGWITALAFAATAGGVFFINKGHNTNTLKHKYNDHNSNTGNQVGTAAAKQL